MAAQNYTLGRGKVYFSRFKTGTQIPLGFKYIGNTPEFSLTIESENLDHFSSDQGIREKDDSVPLEVTRTGSLITDNIDPENVALFFFGEASTVALTSASAQTENFTDVKKGNSYKLGISGAAPAGIAGIDPLGLTVKLQGATLVAATGTLTFANTGSDGDTITIDNVTYTLKTVPVAPYDVDIGADATGSAANLVKAMMGTGVAGTDYGVGTAVHPTVSATSTAGALTATAREGGTNGNTIATTENGSQTSWGGATLSGGTGVAFVEGLAGDYTVDYNSAVIHINDTAANVVNGTTITVTYNRRASSRARVISGSAPVEGAMMYIGNNPKGKNFNYFMPWVKVTPNGDYALKGDEWQQIPFTIEALKPTTGNKEAIYMDGEPAYV